MLVHFIGIKTEAIGLSVCTHTHVDFKTGVDHDGKEDDVHVFASNCIT